MLNEVVKQYDGKLAFVLCPAPLNTHCNSFVPHDVEAFKNSCDLAKIALAIWKISPEAFHNFDSWMFGKDPDNDWKAKDVTAAKAKAVALIASLSSMPSSLIPGTRNTHKPVHSGMDKPPGMKKAVFQN